MELEATQPHQRRALVTGSARGLGLAIARALAADGLLVVGLDVLKHPAGPFERTLRVDLADAGACARVVAEAGDVSVLVNNAAQPGTQHIHDLTADDVDRLMAINLRAPILLSERIGSKMAASGRGRIVNIASIGARTGGLEPSSGVYSATKAGLVAFTKFLARIYGPHGVTANAVAPGGMSTAMSEHLPPETLESYRRAIPLGRLAGEEEVAAVVAFLASDGASFINGATVDVNGGWVMA